MVTSSQEEVVEALVVSQATKIRIENPSWSGRNQLPCDKQSAQPVRKVDTLGIWTYKAHVQLSASR
jgi:NAD kinase